MAHVQGKNASGPLLEKAIGKPPRGSSYVETDFSRNRNAESLQTVFQFKPATADEPRSARAQFNRGIHGETETGFFQASGALPDFSRENAALRLFPTGTETSLSKQGI